jgi:hypothetical protein
MKYLTKVVENFKALEKFSVYVLGFGVRLSLGLLVLSAFFYAITGKFGNYMSALICAKGAMDAAPAVLISAVAAALISDLVIKERTQKS